MAGDQSKRTFFRHLPSFERRERAVFSSPVCSARTRGTLNAKERSRFKTNVLVSENQMLVLFDRMSFPQERRSGGSWPRAGAVLPRHDAPRSILGKGEKGARFPNERERARADRAGKVCREEGARDDVFGVGLDVKRDSRKQHGIESTRAAEFSSASVGAEEHVRGDRLVLTVILAEPTSSSMAVPSAISYVSRL